MASAWFVTVTKTGYGYAAGTIRSDFAATVGTMPVAAHRAIYWRVWVIAWSCLHVCTDEDKYLCVQPHVCLNLGSYIAFSSGYNFEGHGTTCSWQAGCYDNATSCKTALQTAWTPVWTSPACDFDTVRWSSHSIHHEVEQFRLEFFAAFTWWIVNGCWCMLPRSPHTASTIIHIRYGT